MFLRRAALFVPLVALIFCESACGTAGPTSPIATTKPPPAAPVVKPLVPESPARWVFHTPRASALRARMAVEGGVLFGGVGGERWLDRRDGSMPTASTALIPEAVVGLARAPGDKGVLVVGASGAIHLAKDPLGAFDSEKPGPARARAAAAGKYAVVAIVDGGLVRTTDAGASWSKVSLPGAVGTLVDVALSENGLGLALFAPQRVFATQDDGATWQALPTPGVGARRLMVDANGDLVIEGLEASAVLRTGSLRLDRMPGAPRPLSIDAKTVGTPTLGLGRAIAQGRAAVLRDKYFEVITEPDDPTRWRYVYGAFGAAIEPKKLSIAPCDRVWVSGDDKSLFLACDDRSTKKQPLPMTSSAPPPPPPPGAEPRAIVRIYRSEDEGKTWNDEGMLPSRRADSGRIWLTPDGALAIDGACKRTTAGRECFDAGPVIRNPGQKSFAKIGLPRGVTSMSAPAFDGARNNAYSLGRTPNGPLKLLVSNDGGRDFRAVPLPSLASTDAKGLPLTASHAEPGSITVDPATGTVTATARVSGEWVVYSSTDAGVTVRATKLGQKADGVAFAGMRGFAWERSGVAWESSDGGTTWTRLGAPSFPDLSTSDRQIVCAELGCMIGDRAVRIGWGGSSKAAPASAEPKVVSASALKCTAEGDWKNLGAIAQAPSVYDAEITPGVHWTAIKQDRAKGSVSVVVGKQGAKGLELKEVSLFGPATGNVATAVVGQIEGAAAIRFAFKREPSKAPVEKKDPKDPKDSKEKKVVALGPVVDGQTVDVEVAWYVAQTGKVSRATIRGVGPLDARDVLGSTKDSAAVTVGLLSIAQGGVHVRPFATRPEVPLYFVREGGKTERFPWPTIPNKDAQGGSFVLRVDAIRAGSRSVVLGVAGSQLWTAWANDTGTAWDARTWGLWPDLETGDAPWDFTYLVPKDAKDAKAPLRPAIVVQWPGSSGPSASAWALPLRGIEADPGEVIPFATQKSLSDPPTVCGADASAGGRVAAPFSSGTRHPIVVTGEGADQLLATTFAAIRPNKDGDEKSACVVAYEARPIGAKKNDEGGPFAIVPWGDQAHSSLFRTATNGELSVRAMSCQPLTSKESVPPGLGSVEGFTDEP